MAPGLSRGPELPYRMLAGVEPCATGWLVVSAKLQGVSMFPEPAHVVTSFNSILDSRPRYEFVALHCPVGLPEAGASGGRQCDREARALLGADRASAILSPPDRTRLDDDDVSDLGADVRSLLAHIREVNECIASYHQRMVAEVNPELGFYQLNDGVALVHGRGEPEGIDERLAILHARMPGLERVLDELPRDVSLGTVLDACADLWTARRIAARAVVRLPESPEWSEAGLKMELVL